MGKADDIGRSRVRFQVQEPRQYGSVGRNAAVFDFGKWAFKRWAAWLLWAIVHVYFLINLEKRLLVAIQWVGRYLTRQRDARIIDETAEGDEPKKQPSVADSATV